MLPDLPRGNRLCVPQTQSRLVPSGVPAHATDGLRAGRTGSPSQPRGRRAADALRQEHAHSVGAARMRSREPRRGALYPNLSWEGRLI